MNKKLCIIIGTRPELIKVAPVLFELDKQNISYFIINTAQHKELLHPYWKIFNITPTYELDVMTANQSLSMLTSNILRQLQMLFETIDEKFALIMAQGDTTTVMVASMIAFYNKIDFAHIEAGLRSFDFENPFPEEYNRRIASIAAKYNFAPTLQSKNNLLKELVKNENIFITGNTVIDTLSYINNSKVLQKHYFKNTYLNDLEENKVVIISCHRRENHGEALLNIINGVIKAAETFSNYTFIWLLHPNPNVKNIVINSAFSSKSNCLISEPLDYIELIKLMKLCKFIISDSGGIQEEAPSFAKPVVVLRDTTERPEGVELGIAKLCGSDAENIYNGCIWANSLSKSAFTQNPYGDGMASKRIVEILQKSFL